MANLLGKIFSRDNAGAFSLGVLCFQGFGLRIFDGLFSGAIIIWLIVLVWLNRKYLSQVGSGYWLGTTLLLIFYIAFNQFKGVEIQAWILVAWLSAAVALTRYVFNVSTFTLDLSKLTRFCMYYNLAHIPVALLLKSFIIDTNFAMGPKTFMYLFWFNKAEIFEGLNRIQGFCWEPSCWNLLLNINLIFAFYFRKSKKYIAASIIAVLSTYSTTGMMTMLVIIAAYYILNLGKEKIFHTLFMGGLLLALIGPFVYQEFQEKMESGSGQARGGDFAIAAAVMAENPWMGDDYDNITALSYAMNARAEYWTSDGDYSGYMEQGLVNAFAGLVVEWGAPMFLVILFLFYRTPLFIDKKTKLIFMLTMICVLMGTPIARTGFFFMFPFATLLFNKKLSQTYTCEID